MKTMKRALTLIMAVMMVAAMAACGNKPAASNGDETTGDGSLKRVQDAGKLIVACETSWPPFAYIDDKQQLVGYDVEVAAEIAKRLGVEIEYSSSNSWDGIVASLDSGRVDAIFNGVNIAGRVDKYGMTIPYMQNQLVLTVAADNEDIKSFEDLDGKLVANALEGSNGKLAKSYGAELTPAGLAEAMALYLEGKPDMKQYVKQVAFYEPADITEMQVAGCFRIADKELVEACNQALADMKADGTLYDLAVKYLSQDVADSLDVFTK